MEQVTSKSKMKVSVKELTINSMFIALTLLFTALINIRLPIAANGGLIHLGNIPFFIAAILFGRRTGALAGAVGMGLFDLLSGWAVWAPFTIIVVGLMGYVIGKITEKKKGILWIIFALIIAAFIKVVGYYIAECILYGNWLTPFGSIPGNLVQIFAAAVITVPLVAILRKIIKS